MTPEEYVFDKLGSHSKMLHDGYVPLDKVYELLKGFTNQQLSEAVELLKRVRHSSRYNIDGTWVKVIDEQIVEDIDEFIEHTKPKDNENS